MVCSIETENVFGPAVAASCRGGFDFTLLFEELILTIGPIIVVSLLIPFRLYALFSRSPVVRSGWLHHLKLVVVSAFAALQIAMLIVLCIPGLHIPKTKASIISAAVTSGLSIALILLSHLEHVRSFRPSVILSLYLGFSLLFDAVRSRTLWGITNNVIFSILFSVSVGFKFVLFLLESLEKRSNFTKPYEDLAAETAGNVFNRNLFWWLNPFLWTGFKRILEVETLPHIDDRLNSTEDQRKLFAKWNAIKPKTSAALVKLLISTYKWQLVATVLPRLCLTGFTFAQPFLITRTVKFLAEPKGRLDNDISTGLIAATLITYVGLAISTANSQHKTYRVITQLRGSLVSLIYRATLSMSVVSARDSAAVTLMSADVERAGTGLRYMHEIWASPIDLGLGFFLLEQQLGPAAAAPGVIFLLSSLAGLKVAATMGARQRQWLESIQKRVKVTSDMLGAMKEVRMAGLQSRMKAELQKLRAQEIEASRAFKNALALIVTISYLTSSMAPVFAFGIFELLARKNHTQKLNPEKAFTSLALFALLRAPMSLIIDALAGVVSSIGSLQRIGEYLSSDDKVDTEDDPELMPLAEEGPHSGRKKSHRNSGEALPLTEFITARLAPPGTLGHNMIVGMNVSAGWDKKKPFAIKDLDFKIPESTLTFIIGPVGSGKSTLLNAILGETERNSGSIQVAFSQAAFCAQAPWITNDTIQANILGASLYEKEWYERVLDACALRDDIQRLPKGDSEEVGSGGSNLSGGQQARVAIARAVYSRRPMILLDDVMSGLDARTEDLLFNNLFGEKGLLRTPGITVIFATNSVSRLSSAQHIIALNSEGRLLEQGNYDELSLTVKHAQNTPPSYSEINESTKATNESGLSRLLSAPIAQAATGADRRTGDTTVYKYYIQTVGILNTIIFLTFCSAFVFALTFPQYVVKWWAEENLRKPNPRLWIYLGSYGGLGILAIVSLALGTLHLVTRMMPRASTQFHNALLDTAVNAPLWLFSETDVGITVNRFSQDLQLIDMELPLSLFNTSVEMLSSIAQVIMIATSAKFIGAAIPAVLIVFYLIQKFYLRTARQLRLLDIESKGPLFSKFLEALSGLVTIRAFAWEKEFEHRNQETLDLSQRPFYLLYCVQRWLNLVLDFVVTGIAVMVVAIGVKTKGSIDPSLIGLALVNIVGFSVSIKALLENWTQLETSIGAVSRVRSFATETGSEHRPRENQQPPSDWPARGGVWFHEVTATWHGKSKPVMKNLELRLEPGQKLAICGKSGSGKSSMVSSLLRLLDPSDGTIYVDNLDISTVPREEIRSRLICVTQTPYLLSGSVRENVDPFHTANDSEIGMALDVVQMRDFVMELGGLDSQLESDTMSVGQKQLICLARAMLRRGSILILDEATASLDFDTDELVQSVIRTHFKSHTVIAIAHRLNTILDYDRVAVISDGQLVEFDSPSNLLKQEPSTMFADLVRISGNAQDLGKGKQKSGGSIRHQRSQRNAAVHRSQSFHVFPTDDTVPETPLNPIGEDVDEDDWYNDEYEGPEEHAAGAPLIERTSPVSPRQDDEAESSQPWTRFPSQKKRLNGGSILNKRMDDTFQIWSQFQRAGSVRGTRYDRLDVLGNQL